jgi:hypothetical protein
MGVVAEPLGGIRTPFSELNHIPGRPWLLSSGDSQSRSDLGTDVFRLTARPRRDPMELLQNQRQGGTDQGNNQWSGEGTPQQCFPPHEGGH